MQILMDILERRFRGAGSPKQVFSDDRIQKEFIKALRNGDDESLRFVCKLLAECLVAGVKYDMPLEAGIVEHIVHQDKFDATQLITNYKAGKVKRNATLIETVMQRLPPTLTVANGIALDGSDSIAPKE